MRILALQNGIHFHFVQQQSNQSHSHRRTESSTSIKPVSNNRAAYPLVKTMHHMLEGGTTA